MTEFFKEIWYWIFGNKNNTDNNHPKTHVIKRGDVLIDRATQFVYIIINVDPGCYFVFNISRWETDYLAVGGERIARCKLYEKQMKSKSIDDISTLPQSNICLFENQDRTIYQVLKAINANNSWKVKKLTTGIVLEMDVNEIGSNIMYLNSKDI